jgi:hypothetical protein
MSVEKLIEKLLELARDSASLRAVLEQVLTVAEPLLRRLPGATEKQVETVLRGAVSGVDALLPDIVTAVMSLAATGKGTIGSKDDSALA